MSDTGQPPGLSWADEMAAGNPLTSAETTSETPSAAAGIIGSQTARSSAVRGKSWAAVLGGGLPSRADNNVLEVTLEKNVRVPLNMVMNPIYLIDVIL